MNAEHPKKHAGVIVLGDFGRSPRMQYHSLSLSQRGFEVDVYAYKGSAPIEEVSSDKHIHLHLMSEPPNFAKYCPRFLAYGFKALWQFIVLMYAMCQPPRASYAIVQNPPAIPVLLVAWLYCWLADCRLIIDWHNYGYTIMALTLGNGHILVRISKWFESYFGRKAFTGFCVSRAMSEDLHQRWNIKAHVLYDQPHQKFQPLDIEGKHDLFLKLSEEYEVFKDDQEATASNFSKTRFTEMVETGYAMREGRPAVIISSTSWTEDEDFSILLDALEEYNFTKVNGDKNIPDVLCIVTGKGPMKDHYTSIIKSKNLAHVEFLTPWLSPEDYPKLLASADLGICLHTSSSKLDLPMKVVDMFGCGLPVCAVDYPCLHELVKPGENGLVFGNSHELAEQLQELFQGYPKDQATLSKLRETLKIYRSKRWQPNWDTVAAEHFQP